MRLGRGFPVPVGHLLKFRIAESVTTEFFQRHPDWVARYGERGRELSIEDACRTG